MNEPKFKPGDRVQFLNNRGVVVAVETGVKTWGGDFIDVIWDPHVTSVHVSNLQPEDIETGVNGKA